MNAPDRRPGLRLEPLEARAVPADYTLNALGNNGATFRGFATDGLAGYSVAGVSDVGSDGLDDVAVGSPGRSEVYLIAGRTNLAGTTTPLQSLSLPNVTLRGPSGSEAGYSVSGAGDVNRDGFDDLIVGAPGAGGDDRGAAYVVFGRLFWPATIDLAGLGGAGFTIRGDERFARLGESVSGAGDVNRDGFDDLIVGAPMSDNGGYNSGVAYVVYGGGSLGGTTVKPNAPPFGGFTLKDNRADARAGVGVAGAGDVNRDGFADLIVGAPDEDTGDTDTGAAYVVFGGPFRSGTVLTLNAIGAGGITFFGFQQNAAAGFSVDGAGDVNRDGYADVIIGSPDRSVQGGEGEAYLYAGGSGLGGTVVLLNSMGARGVTLSGFRYESFAGRSVAGAGDVNGDGYDDVMVGAPWTKGEEPVLPDPYPYPSLGEAYVIYGRLFWPSTISLDNLGAGGFTLRGFEHLGYAGGSVAGAGDVNGDGLDDVLVGAPYTDAGGDDRGEAYLILKAPKAGGWGPAGAPAVSSTGVLRVALDFDRPFLGGVFVDPTQAIFLFE